MSKFTKPYHGMLPTIREIPPPIFFMTRLKKVEAEGADSDKVEPESIRYEFLLDPSIPDNKFSKEFSIFKDGSPELLELVIRDVGLEYMSRRAIRVQKYYMRRSLFMVPNTAVQQFVEMLNELNNYLLFS
jgi:hypothetical protein